jgi:hypothetical protein
MDLNYVEFQQVDLGDEFFTSLKQDYGEFEQWFKKKSNNRAYIHRTPQGNLDGFLYLKREEESINDVVPSLPAKNRLKVGTFKIDAHGTKLGERFIKKIFDHAVHQGSEEIYVTVFEKHVGLIALFHRYGFKQIATKTTANGIELVLLRKMTWDGNSLDENYPLVRTNGRQFLMSLYPKWHTRLLPDSILTNEETDIIKDVSHANSVHKVYLTAMRGVDTLGYGDILLIYRTSDQQGAAHYRSVATSVCVVEEFRNINSFVSEEEFLTYCTPFSVFTEQELRGFYKFRKYPFVIRFTYNIALKRRPNRKVLIEEVGLNADQYWGFFQLTKNQFKAILTKGEVNESLIVD